jgi:hypothetical protein
MNRPSSKKNREKAAGERRQQGREGSRGEKAAGERRQQGREGSRGEKAAGREGSRSERKQTGKAFDKPW